VSGITPAMRFAAHDWLISHAGKSRRQMFAVRKATYAESFPEGYTAHMVAASEALLARFPVDGSIDAEVDGVYAAMAASGLKSPFDSATRVME